ncbi:ABC transporter substrate-binding protein [Clostridium sp. Marseille-P2415]|uniref:ABC transporter substrate-binding protein n=1 Tax=Clostridium sp. Marseille-P2415 TaxID=1805471 RepID=UPI0009884A69|nr:ABC transporter substrate-binding protein [Clostridium sp. Marseille-P2415]
MKKRMNVLKTMAAVCAVAAVTAGCAADHAKTETARNTRETAGSPFTYFAYDADGTGHEQTVEKAPQKVITNNQTSTELLLKLGLGDRIIATVLKDNPTTDELAAAYDAIPILADKRDISKEKVVGMEPDIVVGRVKSFTPETLGSVSDLNDMGIAAYTQEATRMDQDVTMESILDDIRNIGKIFEKEDQAEEMAKELTSRLTETEDRLRSLEGEPLKVLLMVNYQDGTFGGYGNNASLQKDLLRRLHAVNVLEKGGSALSAENLISMDPDVIVYVKGTHNEENDRNAMEAMLSNEVIQSVKAIQNQKIITVEYNELMGGGYRTFDCMETLADFLYPETAK